MKQQFINGFIRATPGSLFFTIAVDYILVWYIQPQTVLMKIAVFLILVVPDLFSVIASFYNYLQDHKDEWPGADK
ncbi:MAG: hypothetical protein LBT37_02475 [Lactobacillaceae bacterium]|jgi:hypothetical protein|nr:hypothetical protein [Lactobacillaceae bacterium]